MAEKKLVVVFGATGELARPGKECRAEASRPVFRRKNGCGSYTWVAGGGKT